MNTENRKTNETHKFRLSLSDKLNFNGEDVPKLESVEVVLIHCNLVNNNYQQTSKVLFIFVQSKQFGQLINIALHSLTILSTTNTEFHLLKCGLLIKIVSLSKLKIMLI